MTAPLVIPDNFHAESNSVNAAEATVTYGDVNSDGKLDILDLISLKSYVTENNSKDFSVKAADLDSDGIVSAKDAVELSLFLLNQTESFSYEMNIDTDGDGLCDYVEKEMLKTDYLKKDTDGDGLDDYTEVYLCNTNPLETDTGETGIKDPLKDADDDKLSNSEEIEFGTSPTLSDTDEDGINDYDEVKKYKTDPLKPDTDSDGISDNGEVLLGLDPLKAKSDGTTSDTERTFEQTLSVDHTGLDIINNEGNPYTLDISAKAAGYINEAVNIEISSYSNYLQNNAVTGDIIDIDYKDNLKVEELNIGFTVSENAEDYFIFKYFEDVNMLLPVETMYDGNRVYTDCFQDGTYCIIDMNKWINNSSAYDESQMIYSELYGAEKSSDSVEVYFLVYSKIGGFISTKDSIVKASTTMVDYCNRTGKNIKIYYAGYVGGLTTSTETGNQFIGNSSSNEDIQSMVDQIKCVSGDVDTSYYAYSPRFTLQMGIYDAASGNKNCDKYCFVVDSLFQPVCDDAQSTIKQLENLGVNISFICADSNNNVNIYDSLSTDGKHIKWSGDFSDIVVNKVLGDIKLTTFDYSSGLFASIALNSEITYDWYRAAKGELTADEIKKLGLPDSDGDGKLDFEEINMDYVKFDENGNPVLLTFEELYYETLNKYKSKEISKKAWESFIKYYKSSTLYDTDFSKSHVLVLKSNPNLDDSDFDGIPDADDKNPSTADSINVDDSIINDNNIFDDSYKPASNRTVQGNGAVFASKNEKKNTVVKYSRSYFNAKKSTSRFTLKPEHNSDYLFTVDSNVNDNVEIKVFYTNWLNQPKYISNVSLNSEDQSSIEGNIKHTLSSFALEKEKTYTVEIAIAPGKNTNGNYSVSFEQYNWFYAPNGGYIIYTPKQFRDIATDNSTIEKLYLSNDSVYDIIKTSQSYFGVKYPDSFDNFISQTTNYKKTCEVSAPIFLNVLNHKENTELDILVGNIGNIASLGGVILACIPGNVIGKLSLILTYAGGGSAIYSIANNSSTNDELIYAFEKGEFNIVASKQLINSLGTSIDRIEPWNNNRHYLEKYENVTHYRYDNVIIIGDTIPKLAYSGSKWVIESDEK